MFAAGALGGLTVEVGVREEFGEQIVVHAPRCAPGPVRVVGAGNVFAAPGVQKNIARTAVKADDLAVAAARRQERDIGDAADVNDRAGDFAHEDLTVECGHKRSPFAAGGDIAAAEIAYDVKARQLCDECRVVELQCPALFGTMSNRLAVNADGGNVLSADVGHVEQLIDAIYVELAQFDGSDSHAINFIIAGLA